MTALIPLYPVKLSIEQLELKHRTVMSRQRALFALQVRARRAPRENRPVARPLSHAPPRPPRYAPPHPRSTAPSTPRCC